MDEKLEINLKGENRDPGMPVSVTMDLIHWSTVTSFVRQGYHELKKEGDCEDTTATGRWLNEDLTKLCDKIDEMLDEHYLRPQINTHQASAT